MDRLIPIGSYATRTQAEIVEGLLESAGITASIRAADAGGAYPFEFSVRGQAVASSRPAVVGPRAAAVVAGRRARCSRCGPWGLLPAGSSTTRQGLAARSRRTHRNALLSRGKSPRR